MKKFLVVFVSFFTMSCSSEEPEEIIFYELTAKPYTELSVKVDVGGPVGDVEIIVGRDNEKNTLSSLVVEYGSLGSVKLPKKLLNCIENPTIEAPMFYFSDIGERQKVPEDWLTIVALPFSPDESDIGDAGLEIKIPLYPMIEFEISGLKLNRIKVRKSPDEIRIAEKGSDQCPSDLVEWAKGK